MRTAPLVVTAALFVLAGCPAEDPCTEEPAYGGLGNDEVWLALKDAKPDAVVAADSPIVTSPANGAALPSTDTPTFAWESPLKIAAVDPPAPLRRVAPQDALQRLVDGAVNRIGALVIPSARAHEPPVSSDVYLVDVLVPGRTCPVSIVTSELAHELDATTWSILKESAGAELTLQLTSAYLANGRVSEGPFKASDVVFTVE